MSSELVKLQANPTEAQPDVTKTATDMLLVPMSLDQRLRHFPEGVYSLSPESKLVKFIKVLLGDAGAGQLRKRLLLQRMQATLQGSHFYDLDRFYGALFGLRRSTDEVLDFNPYLRTATREEWDSAFSKDASFRSRIEQFSRALSFGPTPAGIELIAEAILAVDVDVYESWVQADASFQTYAELESQFAGNMLSINAFSMETDISDWADGGGINALTHSQDWYFPDGFTVPTGGEDSLAIEVTGAGTATVTHSPGAAITPGTEYTFTAVAYNPEEDDSESAPPESESEGGKSGRLIIDWYDSGPALISSATGDYEYLEPGSPTQVTVAGVAPVGTVSATLKLEIENGEPSEIYHLDRVEFSPTVSTLDGLEGISYGEIEGLGLSRLSGNERRIFTIRPKRQITKAEAYDLRRVLNRIKPADCRFLIDAVGVPLYDQQPIDGSYSDSGYWEVISRVVPAPLAISPYQVENLGEPVEQPRPPFTRYQGEAWSYVSKLAGATASFRNTTDSNEYHVMPPEKVRISDGGLMEFAAGQALMPSRQVMAGRLVSDGILVTTPYERNRPDAFGLIEPSSDGDVAARVFVDGVQLDRFNEVIKSLPDVDPLQQNPEHRYWATPEREMNDPTEEILEIRLQDEQPVNYVTFETAKYPHRVIVEVNPTGSGADNWEEVLYWAGTDSSPKVFSAGNEQLLTEGHPQHAHSNHWQNISRNFDSVTTRKIRIRLRRIDGISPQVKRLGTKFTKNAPYSLAVRAFDIGYRVRDREDFPEGGGVIGTTTDMFGSQVQFEGVEQGAANVLTVSEEVWRCEPQPVNYSVVNLYLDTRDDGEGAVIDRFYLDPTHIGPNLNLYYSNDAAELDTEDPEGFMAERVWTPIPRDFTLQKGYLHIPTTRARYWKFEFTGLVPEPYETFLPMDRFIKLFPRALVNEQVFGQAEEAQLPGASTAFTVALDRRYRDAVEFLGTEPTSADYRPTEAIYVTDLNGQSRMQTQSWVFGFTPWHQEQSAPKFPTVSNHVYEEVEVRHNTKLAFFVGLRELRAYRANFEVNDDPTVYLDTYDDFQNLEPGFDWAFEPGYLTSHGANPPVTVESRTYLSNSPISAVQFATEQSNPVQMNPDSEFRNPALASYGWDNTDSYLKIGDAQLIYSPSDFSVINIRYVVPPLKAVTRTGYLAQPIHKPVFSYRPYEVADEEAAAATSGGLESPVMGLADDGRAYAAVRFTMLTDQTSPLILRVIKESDDSIIASKEIVARRGETIEDYVAFDIPEASLAVRVQLFQEGKSDDSWKLFSLALFDESIVWEFSVNGGGDWYKAKEIRNNDNGILSFPAPGNQLKYRATAYREDLWVSAIKIRPHYLGVGNARPTGTHRGPNVSFYDQDVPINEDPMFTAWKKPVPFYWFAANRRFPLLAVPGQEIDSTFASFYSRPISFSAFNFLGDESESESPADWEAMRVSVEAEVIRGRFWTENVGNLMGGATVSRALDIARSASVTSQPATASVEAVIVSGEEGSPMDVPVHPIFSEDFSESESES